MWGTEFSLEVLKEALQRLGVSSEYYSLDGKMKNHSFFLDRINGKQSKVKFVNDEGNLMGETMKLENWRAYSNLYRRTYSLYLLDQYCQKLIDNNEIDQPFTDVDYKMFLFPSSYGN